MNVIFFPRKDYDVEVCSHRYGKTMAYTEQTDTLSLNSSYDWMMKLAKERKIKVGGFCAYYDCNDISFSKAIDDFNNNHIWLDMYSISTYYNVNGTVSEDEFIEGYNNELLPSFKNKIGFLPIALSYSYGNTQYQNAIPLFFLGGRNSGILNNTNYGIGFGNPDNISYSKDVYKSRGSTFRWYDTAKQNGGTFDDNIEIVRSKIKETKLNGGWINNFTHWHNVVSDNNEDVYVKYMNMLQEENSDNSIWFCGYGEAISYLVYRQMITDAVMYSPKQFQDSQLVIALKILNSLDINEELMQVPISVRFSTIGTPLEGKELKSKCNLIKLTTNDYIIEIPYRECPKATINIKN